MALKEDQENQGFTIKDQRRFNPDGSIRDESAAEPEPGKPDTSKAKTKGPAPETEEISTEAETGLPANEEPSTGLPADFVTLILSLASTAQLGLGIAPHPSTGKPEKNLLHARHAIDLLGVLQEKTRGNLSGEEAQLLEAILSDLRMRYVEIEKKG